MSAVALLVNAFFQSGTMEESPPGLFAVVLLLLLAAAVYFYRLSLRSESGKPEGRGPQPGNFFGLGQDSSAPKEILHALPWKVVERGRTLGLFQNTPIPEWIRTSDHRQADYSGVSSIHPPEKCVCVEIPERSELILPPGLVYIVRS